MRIRKRFPLSSLSSPLLSDPQLNRSPVVQQPLLAATTCSQPSDSPNQTPPPPSDQNPMIESAKDLEDEEGKEKSNFTRKARMLGAKAAYGLLHNQEVGRWCEGDKVVPPKKRGDFGTIMKREKKMKSKTNKIYAKPNEEQGSTANEEGDNGNNSGGKKVKRGNVILEGSRCSRVNGRGWRCCQQTLVGYSLCEYHLGKGRLGSINASVRYRAVATTTASAPKKDGKEQLSSPTSSEKLGQGLEGEEEDDLEDDCKKKPLMVIAKKRMKLGMVKARSLSSLLSQTNSEVVVADNDKNMGSV